MSVTILCALPADPADVRLQPAREIAIRPASTRRAEPEPGIEEPAVPRDFPEPTEETAEFRSADDELEHLPVVASAAPVPPPKRTEAKQEQMLLDPVARGRFERSEPTIVDGQDLDIPTFLRRNVKVK